jgi:hypothetical protein
MPWIKLRTDLLNDPAVYKLAAVLGMDRFSVVGRLAAFWGWADQHAVDGVVDGATSQVVDDVVSAPGFTDAMVAVKWLNMEADRALIPNHDRHNGANAKERSLKSERQAKWRAGQAPKKAPKPVDDAVDGSASTRGDKRRGDKNTPKAPKGASTRFEEFWLAWPKNERKQDKAKCCELWSTRGFDGIADTILADVKVKRGSRKWQEDGGSYIEAPERYLRNQRWEDGSGGSELFPSGVAGAPAWAGAK